MTDRRRTRSGGLAEYSKGLSPTKRKSGGRRKVVAAAEMTENAAISSRQASMHPINVAQWLEENKQSFLPPVCNKLMHAAGQLKIMFVGGPNERKDYHIEEGEEFFYMVKGDMCLKIIEKGVPKDIPIKEGEMFVLPSRIPHSPQRAEDTVGLVIERERSLSEKDGLRFYCEDGVSMLYEEWFHCTDLGTQLVPIIMRFKASEEFKTGKPYKDSVIEDPPLKIDVTTEVVPPISLKEWLSQHSADIKTSGSSEAFGKGEFKISVFGPGSDQISSKGHETFLWQLKGDCTVSSASDNRSCTLHENDSLLLVDSPETTYDLKCEDNSHLMVIWMDTEANK